MPSASKRRGEREKREGGYFGHSSTGVSRRTVSLDGALSCRPGAVFHGEQFCSHRCLTVKRHVNFNSLRSKVK